MEEMENSKKGIKKWYKDLLEEILEEKVKKRQGRRNRRCVKRTRRSYSSNKAGYTSSLPKVKSILILK